MGLVHARLVVTGAGFTTGGVLAYSQTSHLPIGDGIEVESTIGIRDLATRTAPEARVAGAHQDIREPGRKFLHANAMYGLTDKMLCLRKFRPSRQAGREERLNGCIEGNKLDGSDRGLQRSQHEAWIVVEEFDKASRRDLNFLFGSHNLVLSDRKFCGGTIGVSFGSFASSCEVCRRLGQLFGVRLNVDRNRVRLVSASFFNRA